MSFKKIREKLISINRLSLISGISRNQIYNIESGRSVPRLDTAFLLWFILDSYSTDHLYFIELWQDYFDIVTCADLPFMRSSEKLDPSTFCDLQLLAEPRSLKEKK